MCLPASVQAPDRPPKTCIPSPYIMPIPKRPTHFTPVIRRGGMGGSMPSRGKFMHARRKSGIRYSSSISPFLNLSSGCSYIHTKSLTRTFSSCLRASSRSPTERTLLVGPFVWLSFVGYSVFSSLSLLMRLSAFQGEHHLAVGCANGIYFRTRDRVSDSRMSLKHFSRFSF